MGPYQSEYEEISQSLNKLLEYVEKNRFRGYDPYDALNGYLPLESLGKWIPALFIQFQKRNPINIRPLLGISKGLNPKGMGILLKAYCLMYGATHDPEYKNHSEFLFDWLKNNYSINYSGHAWGYNFDWINPQEKLKAYTPSVVVTAFVVDGILEYYKQFKSNEAREIIISASRYIFNDLPVTRLASGLSIAYTKTTSGCCYNASLLGAETLAKASWLTGENKYLDLINGAVSFVLSMQKTDGSWNYSFNPDTGLERPQIDFHQGFILMSLKHIQEYTDQSNSLFDEAIKKGLDFYKNHQFSADGISLWRLPRKWPVDIHNQAQGIITFAAFSHLDNNYLNFANIIASYTIESMQHSSGYFYYRKYRRHTNRISYIRWSQAWMALALATLNNKLRPDAQ